LTDTSDIPAHVTALLNPAIYPHPVERVEMLQTHISWVFLAGNYVYKLKKPVNFGFLDFSTLELRRHYCERELTLNRRFAAPLYLAVLPLCRSDGAYRLDMDAANECEIIDYCLQMTRFDQSDLLDNRLAQGAFDPGWMDMLARDVAAFHADAEINRTPGFDPGALLAEHIRANLAVAAEHVGATVSAADLAALNAFADSELANRRADLQQRRRDGHIRRCHGDLHLRNIALYNGHPMLFDCIEFNDTFNMIDTINDVAFLVMDCDARDRPDLGFRFLSRYLERCGDYGGLSLLPLYLFYRAGVRGKVACMLADELSEPAAQLSEAGRYFSLALDYARRPKPALFVIGGLSGSGKSHLALLGCRRERAVIIRSDTTRKRIAGSYPELALYGEQMHAHTYAAMFDAARSALKAGCPVILDATFLNPVMRRQAYDLARNCGAPLHFYWLEIDSVRLTANIRQRQQRGNDISDADLSVLRRQLAGYATPVETWIRRLHRSDCWPATPARP